MFTPTDWLTWVNVGGGCYKIKNCNFSRYGTNVFGYYLWDYENKKIIKSKYVPFNEKAMYKNQLQRKKYENKSIEYTMLDEIREK